MAKDNIQDILIKKGRELIYAKGADALTARKLSEISGYSVGTIYNQFGSMDRFVLLQNCLTLEELQNFMQKIVPHRDAYVNINRYLDAFVTFVLNNQNFWSLLFGFHLKNNTANFSRFYLRKIASLMAIVNNAFRDMYPNLNHKERAVMMHTLWLSLFSLSSFLTAKEAEDFSRVNRKTICKLLLNTYLAGLLLLPEK